MAEMTLSLAGSDCWHCLRAGKSAAFVEIVLRSEPKVALRASSAPAAADRRCAAWFSGTRSRSARRREPAGDEPLREPRSLADKRRLDEVRATNQ